MIVTTSFLAISLIIGFIFLGIKMSESIQHGDIKVFFFTLYTITLLTLINIVISFYFYNKTIKKRGQKGNRGLQGKVGDKGDSGYCESSCQKESLKMLLVNEYKTLFPFIYYLYSYYYNILSCKNLSKKFCFFEFAQNHNYIFYIVLSLLHILQTLRTVTKV